jgi:hypothetical protein
MKIIYAQDNGVLAQLIPAPNFLAKLAVLDADGNDTVTLENKLIHIANKDLPTGTPYEITDEDLSDRTFRGAWEYVAGANEKTSEDLSLDDQFKYNKLTLEQKLEHGYITQEEYDANAG